MAKFLYKCSLVDEHIYDKVTATAMCPECNYDELPWLTTINAENTDYEIYFQKWMSKQKPTQENLKEKFDNLINNAAVQLENKNFDQALVYLKSALNLNYDNIKVNKKIQECEALIKKNADDLEKIKNTPKPPVVSPKKNQEYGLFFLMLDCSQSMNEFPFKGLNHSGKELIATAVSHAIFDLKNISQKHEAFIYIFLFDHSIKPLMPPLNIDSIINEFQSAENFKKFLLTEMNKLDGQTDINQALKVAYTQATKFINGEMKGLFGNNYDIFYHSVALPGAKNLPVPNVRVVLYTDGIQYVDGQSSSLIVNPFLDTDIFKVNILIGAFFGEVGDNIYLKQGFNELMDKMGYCPRHPKVKNFFHFGEVGQMGTLKDFFKMGSGPSGFCPECLRENSQRKIDIPIKK